MLPTEMDKIKDHLIRNLRNDLGGHWTCVTPPSERPDARRYRHQGGNRAFEYLRIWGQRYVDEDRWVITTGYFEREDLLVIFPVYSGWVGSKSTPKPRHVGWLVEWREERLGIMPVCSAYQAMRAADAKWSKNKPLTGRMALLMDEGSEAPVWDGKPVEQPPGKVTHPLRTDKLYSLSEVLRDLVAEDVDPETWEEVIEMAAARLEWLERQS